MKKSKKVILWGREDSLGIGVEFFLAARTEWDVVRISDTHNVNNLMEEVENVRPDVVIIYQGDCADDTDLPALLMQGHPGLKVITVSLENNSMEVYSKQKILVNKVSDLLTVVES